MYLENWEQDNEAVKIVIEYNDVWRGIGCGGNDGNGVGGCWVGWGGRGFQGEGGDRAPFYLYRIWNAESTIIITVSALKKVLWLFWMGREQTNFCVCWIRRGKVNNTIILSYRTYKHDC